MTNSFQIKIQITFSLVDSKNFDFEHECNMIMLLEIFLFVLLVHMIVS